MFSKNVVIVSLLAHLSFPLYGDESERWYDPESNMEWIYRGVGNYHEAIESCFAAGDRWNFPFDLSDDHTRSLARFMMESPLSDQIENTEPRMTMYHSGYRPWRRAWAEDRRMTENAIPALRICPPAYCPSWVQIGATDGTVKTHYHLFHDRDGTWRIGNDGVALESEELSIVCFKLGGAP